MHLETILSNFILDLNTETMQDYWYNQFLSIPNGKDTFEYKRLKHLWANRTRFKGKEGTKARKHELCNEHHETHLTATLFENFSLFNSFTWLDQIIRNSNLEGIESKISQCKWSYEWGYKKFGVHRIYDIIIHFKTVKDQQGVIVIEAKNLKKKISVKDTDPGYYLDVEALENFGKDRFLIYLVDQEMIVTVKDQVNPSPFSVGYLSWQQLAGIQIKMVDSLTRDDKINGFIRSSLNYQYSNHQIIPDKLPYGYLLQEPNMDDIDSQVKEDRQTETERYTPIWKADFQ